MPDRFKVTKSEENPTIFKYDVTETDDGLDHPTEKLLPNISGSSKTDTTLSGRTYEHLLFTQR